MAGAAGTAGRGARRWHGPGKRGGMSPVPSNPFGQPCPPSSPGNFFPPSVHAEEIVLSGSDCGAHCPQCNTCMFLKPRHLSNRLRCLVFTRLRGRGGGGRESGLFVWLCWSLAACTDIMPIFFLLLLLLIFFCQVGTGYSCMLRGVVLWTLLPCKWSLL